MQKIKYPLIVSDFDGTLVKNDGTIGEKTRSAINQFIADGGKFAICTGRMPSAILPRARELGLKGVLCCGQGSVIIDIESGQPIMQGKISHDLTLRICKKTEEMGLHTHIYGLFDYYTNKDDEALRLYEEAVKIPAKRILDRPLWKFVEETGFETFKVLTMVEPCKTGEVIEELSKMNFEDCVITQSAKFLVEVCNAKYSKATALEFLAKEYGVPIEKTIAIGDQLNDMPMIERAGLGLAVANAQEELIAKATVLPYTNDEDAVAYAIKHYGYEE